MPTSSAQSYAAAPAHSESIRRGRSTRRAARMSGWFVHLAQIRVAQKRVRRRERHRSSNTSFLDKVVRYLLDGDGTPNRSAKPIWLLGVQLPGWEPEDEARVAAANSSHHHPPTLHSHSPATSTLRPLDSSTSNPSADSASTTTTLVWAVDSGPWPAVFHAVLRASLVHVPRTGFETIRDFAGLAAPA